MKTRRKEELGVRGGGEEAGDADWQGDIKRKKKSVRDLASWPSAWLP